MFKKELKVEKIKTSNKKECEDEINNLKNKDFDMLLFCYKSYIPINHYKSYIPTYNRNRIDNDDNYRIDILLVGVLNVEKNIETLKEDMLDLSKKISKPIIIMSEEACGAIFMSYANYYAKDDETIFMWTTNCLSDRSSVERNIFSSRDIKRFEAIRYKGLKLALDDGIGDCMEKYMAYSKINKGIDYIVECFTGKVF